MTILFKDGTRLEFPDNAKPLVTSEALDMFAQNVRAYHNRIHLARIKSQLKDFSIKSMKWRDEQ